MYNRGSHKSLPEVGIIDGGTVGMFGVNSEVLKKMQGDYSKKEAASFASALVVPDIFSCWDIFAGCCAVTLEQKRDGGSLRFKI